MLNKNKSHKNFSQLITIIFFLSLILILFGIIYFLDILSNSKSENYIKDSTYQVNDSTALPVNRKN